MHLAILTQYYPPEIGAPQKRLSELAERLVSRGHEVTVLTAMPNYPTGKVYPGYGGIWSKEIRNGVSVQRVCMYPSNSTRTIARLLSAFSFVFSSMIAGTLLLPRADALLVESPPLFLGLSGWWLSRIKRMPLIMNVSDLWPETVAALGRLDRRSIVFRLGVRLEYWLYRSAWMVTGQARGIVDHVAAAVPDKPVYHLSNGVDTQIFRADAPKYAFTENGEGRDECLIAYCGLHGVAQGLDQVLDAAELLRDLPVTFHLFGDGAEKSALVASAAKRGLTRVRFHDAVSADTVPGILAATDIALVPLKTTIPGAVPSKVYEAMAASRAVILVADGEPAEIVRKNTAGLVVSPGDINGLADAVRRLAADPALRTRLGTNGRAAVERHYSRDTIVSHFITHLTAAFRIQ